MNTCSSVGWTKIYFVTVFFQLDKRQDNQLVRGVPLSEQNFVRVSVILQVCIGFDSTGEVQLDFLVFG